MHPSVQIEKVFLKGIIVIVENSRAGHMVEI
jgi:hypothetical protein